MLSGDKETARSVSRDRSSHLGAVLCVKRTIGYN